MEWTTQDEINFIEGLGFHRHSDKVVVAIHADEPILGIRLRYFNRRDLLKGYLDGLVFRDNWEGLDEDLIWATASMALAKEKS